MQQVVYQYVYVLLPYLYFVNLLNKAVIAFYCSLADLNCVSDGLLWLCNILAKVTYYSFNDTLQKS